MGDIPFETDGFSFGKGRISGIEPSGVRYSMASESPIRKSRILSASGFDPSSAGRARGSHDCPDGQRTKLGFLCGRWTGIPPLIGQNEPTCRSEGESPFLPRNSVSCRGRIEYRSDAQSPSSARTAPASIPTFPPRSIASVPSSAEAFCPSSLPSSARSLSSSSFASRVSFPYYPLV